MERSILIMDLHFTFSFLLSVDQPCGNLNKILIRFFYYIHDNRFWAFSLVKDLQDKKEMKSIKKK